MDTQDLVKWIENTFRTGYDNIKVDFESSSQNIDGYIGEVNFMVVERSTFDGKLEKVHLVVKSGKRNPIYREFLHIEYLFRQEMIAYEQIFPLYYKFQKERNLVEKITFAKCYGTLSADNVELIMLKNLKTAGYRMNDRKRPLDLEHLTVTLEFYAKLHALSLAMQDQKYKQFENLVAHLEDGLRTHLTSPMMPVTKQILKKISETFLGRNEQELHMKVNKMMEENEFDKIFQLFDLELPFKVISHCDSWNNNILYRYRDNNAPTQAIAIDWQMTSVRNSPIYDVLQLFYCSCSPEDLSKHWKDYLKIYHDFLSNFLQELGSDPNIFTHDILLQHWKLFSLYGIMYVPLVLKLMYFESEDVVGLDQTTDMEQTFRQWADAPLEDESYHNRVVGLFKFYFDQNS